MDENMLPQFEVDLPYINKKVKVRPFVVKEEKLLLIAAESGEENDIIQATLQVVQNCILDDTKVDKLPFFLVDYLFITLRSKSVGEKVQINFQCKQRKEDGSVCGAVFPADLDILDAKFERSQEIDGKILLSADRGFKMRWPTYQEVKQISDKLKPFEQEFELIQSSIEMYWNGEKVVSIKDTEDKFQGILEGLTGAQYNKLREWVHNFPTFSISVEKECIACGYKHKLQYKDFSSFF